MTRFRFLFYQALASLIMLIRWPFTYLLDRVWRRQDAAELEMRRGEE